MENGWNAPKIIIGKDATGQYYYRREYIENEIWSEIKKGNNVLIAAPRRVGKTSVMKYLIENTESGYKLIFRNVQGIDTEKEFYKTIYELIIKCLNKFKSNKQLITDYFKQKKITEISWSGGITIEDNEIDYLYEINNLIPKLDVNGETIVLLIDELPEVLHNLHKKGNNDIAKSIIKNLRQWRQENGYEKLQFVLAGSVGIHYVVNLIDGRTSDINDLNKIYYQPLNENEVDNYIDWATAEASVLFSDVLKEYLRTKIQYFVPYFINLMLDEIDKTARKNRDVIISEIDIDNAFNSIIRNNDYFSDWKKRLSDYLPKDDFKFVNDILKHIAHRDQITIQEIYNKAQFFDKEEDYMSFIKDLTQDGYIVESNNKYIFISPFLKEFWKLDNPVYNG
ncbi:AAA-like domain-containing protein [Flavobacterium gyeonganense]|uniref:AAA-like domain-containing protein n=1 Tax=Flavobacterium gyeonganense TaxID=1310418 RepID=A0ABV5HFC2_9FLAO|nr:AAA-like domain-containing protein [Flavobacterium gyeonganense]